MSCQFPVYAFAFSAVRPERDSIGMVIALLEYEMPKKTFAGANMFTSLIPPMSSIVLPGAPLILSIVLTSTFAQDKHSQILRH